MRAVLDILWAPKHGNSVEEYEDAFAPYAGGALEGQHLRIAVADGATEAAFSKLWARLLVGGYRKGWIDGADGGTRRGLERLGRIWRRRTGRRALPWYGEEKRRLGSFAALVGLELSASGTGATGTWRSYSVGDCCLFHLRGDSLLRSFPIEDPDEFGSRPVLLASEASRNRKALASAATAMGEWAEGDEFYLMSDALACWFLAEHRSGEPAWDLAREDEADFPDLISHLRRQCGLRNDDVTLLRITPVPGPASGGLAEPSAPPDASGPCGQNED